MLLTILMLVFGISALAKGSFKITGSRQVTDTIARVLGVILIIGAFVSPLIALIAVIIIGLATSEKIEKEPEKIKNF